ncbi:MAG: outer membrane beta-barrel protein [Pseudobdellovibrio sp.]
MKSILALIVLLGSSYSFAFKNPFASTYSMPSVEVGFRSSTATVTGSSSDKQENGFQLGVSGVFNVGDSFGIKSGLFYTERPFGAEFSGSTVTGKINYFEVPVFAMLKLEDYAGIYAGPSVAIHMGDELSTGSLNDVKSMITPITLGAQFKFLPNFGVNVFFENVSGDLATGVSNSRAVGVNLMITLD